MIIIITFLAVVLHSWGIKIRKCGNECPEWLQWGRGNCERVGKAHCIERLNYHGYTLFFGCVKCGSSTDLFSPLAPCGAGAPLFPPCPFTSSSFPLFTFLFLSLALPIFFFCPSLPFLPEYSHSVSRPEVVGSGQTGV